MKYPSGRHTFGLAIIACGLCALVWGDFFALGNLPHHQVLTYIMAAVEILGGVAVLCPRTVRAGAVALGTVFFVLAGVSGLPPIFQHPLSYGGYGNFFYPFSVTAGAMSLYASFDAATRAQVAKLAQVGYYSFGVCLVSFTLEQIVYFHETAVLVPKWLPPGQMFWAFATTAAFGVAAIALLTRCKALLAAQLTTAMIVGFGLLTWVPALFADPHSFWSWSETTETFAIAASARIVADQLVQRAHMSPLHPIRRAVQIAGGPG